jgi:hypothetical protein
MCKKCTEGVKNMKPRTYDMTFCVSKCKNKCDRHYSLYEFEGGRLYSMADFNCEKSKEKNK